MPMVDLYGSTDRLSTSDLELEELDLILDRIDDNLAFWQVIFNERAYTPEEESLLPLLAQVGTVSDWLKMSSAPLYPTISEKGLRGFLFRFFNMFVKIFGAEQIIYNRKFREFLAELMALLHESEKQAAVLRSNFNDLERKVQKFDAANLSYQLEIDSLVEQVAALREQVFLASDDPSESDPETQI